MTIQTFHVGVKAVIVRDGKILAVKHKVYGTWGLPGGRIDDGETIEETLHRELKEELGIDHMEIGDIICALRDPRVTLREGGGLVLIAYNVLIPAESQPTLTDEHSDLQWLPFDEALLDGTEIVQEVVKRLS